MPKQKGLIKLTGNLQGLCYYQLNGTLVVRKASGPSKARIYNDPAFVRVKGNTQEFGGASKLSKAIRDGLPVAALEFKDSYMASRLSGLCRSVIQKGRGIAGQRAASLFNDPNAIIGFPLGKDHPLDRVYNEKPIITTDSSRTNVLLNIIKSTPDHLGQMPKTATHFKLVAALSMVSNYCWNAKAKTYLPEHPKYNAIGVGTESDALVCTARHTNLQLVLQLPVPTPIPETVTSTLWFGIVFGYLQEQEFIPFKSARAMECIALL